MQCHGNKWFQAPGEPHEGATHASCPQFCLVFSLIAMPAENVWPPHSKSACSQLSPPKLSFTSRPGDVCVGMDLYRRYVGFSPASKELGMLSQSKHWSSGHWVCRTCSAAPDIAVDVLMRHTHTYNFKDQCTRVEGVATVNRTYSYI